MRSLSVVLLAGSMAAGMPGMAGGQTAGAALHVRTADGRSTYFIGERVPLMLDFTAPQNKQFEASLAQYDRIGRTYYDSFNVQPATGWADPLAEYFGGNYGSMGGGFSPEAVLSPAPTSVPINLNEWVRFDRPGTYRITVSSRRVRQMGARAIGPLGSGPTVRGNPIEVHIVAATEAWQAAKLAEIRKTLEKQPAIAGTSSPERSTAIADLRFLMTQAAVEWMAHHLRDDESDIVQECALGLAGVSPRLRPFALATLEKLIDEPTVPISTWYLQVMPALQLEVPSETGMEEAKERERWFDEDRELVVRALPEKVGEARALTAEMLLAWEGPSSNPQATVEIGRAMASTLQYLPADRLEAALNYHWDAVNSPALLPLLKRWSQTPLKRNAAGIPDYQTRGVKAVALRRWYEFEPAGAHEEAMRQISSEHPLLTAESLAFLPAEKLPEFERVWGRALMATDDYLKEATLLGLMTRFGTGAELGLVRERAAAKVGKWECAPQSAALAYLVKFDPATAAPLVERAERERGTTGCYRTLFQDISQNVTDPVLIQAAIDTLDDADADATADALTFLGNYGDVSAKEPVWQRYVKWNEEWKGREDAIEKQGDVSDEDRQRFFIGTALVQTLLGGQGWFADRDLLVQVQGRCVGEQVCAQAQQMVQNAAVPYALEMSSTGTGVTFQIAQYNPKSLALFEAKVKQFPRGSRFQLIDAQPMTDGGATTAAQVRSILKKDGMVLTEAEASALTATTTR